MKFLLNVSRLNILVLFWVGCGDKGAYFFFACLCSTQPKLRFLHGLLRPSNSPVSSRRASSLHPFLNFDQYTLLRRDGFVCGIVGWLYLGHNSKIRTQSETKPKKHIFTYANVYLICKTRWRTSKSYSTKAIFFFSQIEWCGKWAYASANLSYEDETYDEVDGNANDKTK